MIRVLVVDDSPSMRQKIIETFRELSPGSFEVCGEAGSGSEAIQQYKELHPDIVTMDIAMPNMNGIDAVREIKLLDTNAKIIMVSSIQQKSMVFKALSEGASSYVMKPFTKEMLANAIEMLSDQRFIY
jgi:two-component system, chemotaxis family, chemotaxis protein CheY